MDNVIPSPDIDRERRRAEDHLRQMLDDAESSGLCEDTVEQIWAEAEAEYFSRHL